MQASSLPAGCVCPSVCTAAISRNKPSDPVTVSFAQGLSGGMQFNCQGGSSQFPGPTAAPVVVTAVSTTGAPSPTPVAATNLFTVTWTAFGSSAAAPSCTYGVTQGAMFDISSASSVLPGYIAWPPPPPSPPSPPLSSPSPTPPPVVMASSTPSAAALQQCAPMLAVATLLLVAAIAPALGDF